MKNLEKIRLKEIFEKLDKSDQVLQEYLELSKKYPEDVGISGRLSILHKTISQT